jgi:GT2 family glycosyltransferase
MNVDVVVPIYNAFNALSNCLFSLEKYQSQISKIILINDASTDNRVKPFIDKIASKNNWQVIHQLHNKGFVKTANLGLKLSGNHTVLLNSDTVVTKTWIIAFKQALELNPSMGTLTPWSNNAEICSFPHFLQNQTPIKKLDDFANILFENHPPQYPIIPTAVGFCMLISMTAKKRVGYFDENHFGHGYGEENDYSMRVTEKGLTNLLCDNAYVVHIGNQSFNDFGLKPNEQTMQRLLIKHPKYLQIIQEFIKSDPFNTIRKEILSLLKTNNIDF